MKNVKIKTNQNEKEISISIFADGKELHKITKYKNTCLVCKSVSINDNYLGDKYICPECMEIIKDKITIKNTTKKIRDKKKKDNKKISYNKVKGYSPDIKITNIVNYQNLMTHHKIPEQVLTTIIDLIIKGVNTTRKIYKALPKYSIESIYTYLTVMAKIGMLQPMDYLDRSKHRYNKIYKVHSKLVYTSVK